MTSNIEYTRQLDILNPEKLKRDHITFIGSGAVGSFAALTLAKMGSPEITIYDDDGVTWHNLPNQFYRKKDIRHYKVDALKEILGDFSNTRVTAVRRKYTTTTLTETVIVATDSMSSRKLVWDQFKKQTFTKTLIEARMGAELGIVYTIRKTNRKIAKEDIKFYEDRLYPDSKVKPIPCTERTIIYNVLMIASLISRAYKGIMSGEDIPRELIFNMTSFDERSFMFRR